MNTKSSHHLKLWRRYSKEVKENFFELYKNTGALITVHIKGRVLDVGFGDVFNYDISSVRQLVTVDLYPVKFRNRKVDHKHVIADVRDLPFKNDNFHFIVAQFLFHHLAESSVDSTNTNFLKALRELKRVLKPRGEILIVESFLPRALEILEETAYPLLVWFCKIIDFPQVRQYSVSSFLRWAKKAGLKKAEMKKVDKGSWVSQFGRKFPAWLTPVQVYFFRFKKL